MEQAASSGASTGQYKKVADASRGAGGSAAKPKMKADTVKYKDTVHTKDRMTSAEVIDWLNKLVEIDNHLNTDAHVETF